MEKNSRQYAGFWVRLIADFVDSILLDLVTFLVVCIVLCILYLFKKYYLPPGQLETLAFFDVVDPFILQLILGITRGILSLFYYSWATFQFGTTVGKKLMGVYVISYDGGGSVSLKQSVLRTVSYAASYLPVGAGFLMIIFHPEKRALHDLIAGTVSIIKPKK